MKHYLCAHWKNFLVATLVSLIVVIIFTYLNIPEFLVGWFGSTTWSFIYIFYIYLAEEN